jgi:hypothetical protein
MRSNHSTLLQLDVENAFNSIPHEVIRYELKKRNTSILFQDYLDEFLKARHCKYSDDISCGVP